MAYIEFRDVTKIYGSGEAEIHALDGVSFSIEEGEFVCLLVLPVPEKRRSEICSATRNASL